MRACLLALFLFLSTIALAIRPPCHPSFRAVVETVDSQARYALPIGGAVKLDTGKGAPLDAVFLGRLVGNDGVAHEWAFYEKATDKIHIFPAAEIVARGPAGEIPTKGLEPMVKNTAQEGGTCGAFTLFHCFMLLKHQGRLSTTVRTETEQDRHRLLGLITASYYGRNQPYESTVVTAGAGTVVTKMDRFFWSVEEFKRDVIAGAQAGDPLVLTFALRPWAQRPFKTIKYLTHGDEIRAEEIERSGQWLPKRQLRWWQYLLLGQTKSGRHAVMVRGVVEGPDGSRKLWVSDPNFEYPVLWDVSELDHARSAEMGALTLSPVHQLTDADEEK